MRLTKILLVILLTVPSSASMPCNPLFKSEIKDSCGGCGLCLIALKPPDETKIYVCAFDKQQYFYAEDQCKVVDTCNDQLNKGKCSPFKCLPMFGSFKCDCDKNSFGRFCEFSKPQATAVGDYAVVADIILTPLMTIGEYGTMSVLFTSLGKNALIEVLHYHEYLTFNSKACKEVIFADYCKHWYGSYPQLCKNNPNLQGKLQCVLTVNFIFKSSDHKAKSLNTFIVPVDTWDNIGLEETITVTVYNDVKMISNSPVFNDSYYMINLLEGIHIKYFCDPKVRLLNVAHSMQRQFVVTYAMRDEIIVPSLVEPSKNPKCPGAHDYMSMWKVWKVTVNLNIVFQKPFKEVFQESEIVFKPFSLTIGVYKILLNVTCLSGQDIYFEFYIGYFEVIELDLEAILSGGKERVIHYNEESLKLDGSQSWNPNLPPSKQLGSLKFFWRCNRTDVAFCEEKQSDYNIIYPGPFLANEYYKFYLTVKYAADESQQDTTSQIIFMTSTKQISVELICRKNCGWRSFQSNPGVVIYFEAVVLDSASSSLSNSRLNWTYSPGSGGNYLPVDNIRQNNTPNNILIVLKDTLSAGENYTFRAKGEHENVGEATFFVKMAKKLNNVSCELGYEFENTTIVRAVTKFTVTCNTPNFNKFAPFYDFYDMYPGENGTGRLIASTRSKIESEIVLSRGQLVVQVTDEYGMTTLSQVNVKLKDTNITREFIFNLLNSLRQNHDDLTSYANSKTNEMSVIYDMIVREGQSFTDITEVLEYILKESADLKIEDVPILKVVSSLLNTIATGDLKTRFSMKSVNYLSKSVIHLSETLLFKIKQSVNLTDISELSIPEIYKLCRQLLQICNSVYESSTVDLAKKLVQKLDRQDYHASYRDSSSSMMRSLRNIMSCLSLITLPYEWPTILKEDGIKIWVKEDTPEAFSESGYESVPSVEVSEVLAKSIGKVSKFVIIQVVQFDDNPYCYNRQFNISTNAVDLRMLFKVYGNVLRTTDIFKPVVINLRHMETKRTVINGSVYQPDSNKSLDVADMQVAVHQLRVPQMGRLVMKFLNLEDEQTIRIKVLYNKRPDYEFMIGQGTFIITKSSPYLGVDLKAPQSYNIYDLYYIGILPGSNHPIDYYINYSFELSTFHCISWNFHEWSTEDCKIKGATESSELQCECEVFSTFAAFSQIPLNKLDPFNELKLILTETDNLFVQILLGLLLLAFLLLLLLLLWKDNSNVKGKVIYLEDNFPGDKCSYLVAVFTGSKSFGGTTSNVGIMIEGDKSCSRPHILRCSWRRTLRTGEDDWFLLSTISHLGNLKMIHLWMDYSGRRPEWYCYKIIIIDMLSHNHYLFLVDAWLSLRGSHFIERFVKATKSENDKRLNIVVDNLIFGLRDTHLWLGVWFGHPRSIVSRAQRFATAFNELLVIMLVSCLFLSALESRSEDYPYYHLSSRILFIAALSVIVSSFLVNILMSVFRKTFLFKDYEKKENKEKLENSAISNPKHKSTNFIFRCFEDFLKVFINRKKFKPVILQFDKRGISRTQKKYSLCCLKIGWTVTLVMIIICFVIMYYFSMRMRKVKTLVWLTCITISLLLVLFIIAPLKIFGLAVLSGLFYYNINQVVSYHIRMHLLNKYKRNLIDSHRHLVSKLISMRRHSCYVPLTYKKIMKRLHKQRKFDAILLLLDMFLIGVLLVLLFMQNESLWTTKYYWNNKQLRSLLRRGYTEEGVQLYSLRQLSDYSLFLDKNVFPVVYQSKWYNKQPIADVNSTADVRFVFGGTSKLFGLPRLRQIRLKPDLCEKPIYENLSQYCNVKLTEDTEDTNLYADGWVETGPHEKFRKVSPWNYMNDSETYETTLYGYSNIPYKGDGYVAELDMTEEKAEDIVLTLHQEKWLDRRTCVVTFELTLYNAFSGTFSWLISVTENLHIGLLMNRVYVVTVSESYEFPIVDLVFFVGLLMFTVRVFFVVNRNGIDDLTEDFWNVFEMIMVCLGISCALFFLFNIYSKFNYFNSYKIGHTREQYFEFLHLLQYLDLFRIILSVLAIMLVCRFIKSWRFGKTVYRLLQTFSHSWGIMAVLCLLLVLVSCLYWAFFFYTVNDFMASKHNFPVMSKIDFKHIVKTCNTISCKIIPFVLCLVALIVQVIIFFLLLVSFRIVKRKNIEIAPMNFCTVFFERFKKFLYEMKHKSKKRLLKL